MSVIDWLTLLPCAFVIRYSESFLSAGTTETTLSIYIRRNNVAICLSSARY